MIYRLLLALLLLAPLQSAARTEHRSPFQQRALAAIKTPSLQNTARPGWHAASAGQPPAAATPIWNEAHFLQPPPLPDGRNRAPKGLIPGGILLTALGGAGIVLGAATLDSSEKAVSVGLIVTSSILVIIGAGLIFAGTYMRSQLKRRNSAPQ